ncbi:MAG: CRISPR-associated protein Cas4 [Candidatus Poribacteria bacterium]|nr:MAG: CRISPR-associated protein Cas4 [Candidatus Poribacteria bacterium]
MERVTGTLVHYAKVCPRKVWLMAHELGPDEDHPLLELGRFLGERAYPRERLRRVALPGMVLDWVRSEAREGGEELLVVEVKKSARLLEASRLQLLFYLQRLEEHGIAARGEVRIPQEHRRFPVELTSQAREELMKIVAEVLALCRRPLPPPPHWIGHCRGCAYTEFCWAELDFEGEEANEGDET